MRRIFPGRRSPLLRGPRDIGLSPHPFRGDRTAFIASYGNAETFSRSVIELTRALTLRSYDVVVVRASGTGVRASWPADEEAIRPTIVWRPNTGYDFGSWAVGIDTFKVLAARPYVLLFNDSMVGPFGPIDAMIDHFEATTAEAWSATSTLQFEPHLQSFILGFRDGLLARYPLSRFWQSIRSLGDKQQVIHEYEMGLSRLLEREMLTTDAFRPAEMVVRGELNPVIDGWDTLLASDFPFVKRELLRLEHFAPIREKIREDVGRRYGQEPMEWFENL